MSQSMTVCCYCVSSVLYGEKQGGLRVESIQIMLNGCLELLCGALFVFCSSWCDLGYVPDVPNHRRLVSGRWMTWWGMEGRRGDGISLPLREKRELCCGGERLMLHRVIWQQTTDSKFMLFLPLGPGVPMVPFPKEIARVSICLAPQG